MKKIGVIDFVKYSGPGTKNIIYKDPEVDGYVYVQSVVVSVFDEKYNLLKSVLPKYDRNNLCCLGDIVEYDDETNRIKEIDLFRKLTEDELNQIRNIYQRYSEMKKGVLNHDLLIKILSECSTLEELKKILSSEPRRDRFDIEMILNRIKQQMIAESVIKTRGLKK